MSEKPYESFADLEAEARIPARGIHSQTLSSQDGLELVLFAFATGEALTEHTSARAAIIHILQGEAEVTLGEDRHHAPPGFWARMPAGLNHAIHARTPLVMALYLLPRGPAGGEG